MNRWLQVGYICIIIAFTVYFLYPIIQNRPMISFLNVGQGDATLITGKNREHILVDCGPDETILDQLTRKISFLEKSIDILIITHGDSDHFGGCIAVMQKYSVKKIMINGVIDNQNSSYISTLQYANDQNIEVLPSIEDTYITLDSMELRILNPQENQWGKEIRDDNAESIVIYGITPNTTFLLMGDVPSEVEQELIQIYPNLNVDILKVGHHGSKTSSSTDFLSQITPNISVVSAGINNRYQHPDSEVIQRLQEYSNQVIEVKYYLTGFDIYLDM